MSSRLWIRCDRIAGMTSQKKNRSIRQKATTILSEAASLPTRCCWSARKLFNRFARPGRLLSFSPTISAVTATDNSMPIEARSARPNGAEVLHDPRALLGHELAVTHGNDLGSKKTRRGAALLAMGFALLEEDRRTATPGEAIRKIRHEARLTQTAAAKDLPRKVYATYPDFFARYALKCGLVICPVVERCFPVVSAVQLHWVKSPYRSRYR